MASELGSVCPFSCWTHIPHLHIAANVLDQGGCASDSASLQTLTAIETVKPHPRLAKASIPTTLVDVIEVLGFRV